LHRFVRPNVINGYVNPADDAFLAARALLSSQTCGDPWKRRCSRSLVNATNWALSQDGSSIQTGYLRHLEPFPDNNKEVESIQGGSTRQRFKRHMDRTSSSGSYIGDRKVEMVCELFRREIPGNRK